MSGPEPLSNRDISAEKPRTKAGFTSDLMTGPLTPDKHGVKRAELLIGGIKAPLSYCYDNDGRNPAWHGTPYVEGYQYRVSIDARGVVTFWDRPAPVFWGADGVRIP